MEIEKTEGIVLYCTGKKYYSGKLNFLRWWDIYLDISGWLFNWIWSQFRIQEPMRASQILPKVAHKACMTYILGFIFTVTVPAHYYASHYYA